MPYIEDDSEASECLFCHLLREEDGPTNLILHRGEHAYIVLNRFPYTNGHMLIVPYEHEATLELLSSDTRSELMELAAEALARLRQVYDAQAFNLGVNIGAAAGAGIVEHVHLHIVPRWGGDTNFMAATASTRVLPESLEATYQRLADGWKLQP